MIFCVWRYGMNTLDIELKIPQAMDIHVSEDTLRVGNLLVGIPSGESQSSSKKWLLARTRIN